MTNYCQVNIVYAVIGDSFEESADRLVEKAKDGGGIILPLCLSRIGGI